MREKLQILERALVGLIIALICTPLVASLRKTPGVISEFLKNSSSVSAGWHSLEAARSDWPKQVNSGFYGRDFLINWTDELWFRLFRVCTTKSAGITVGKEGTLFETNYIKEYCISRKNSDSLEPLVASLKQMQDVCSRFNIAFVLLITPSKASIMPEAIPSVWMRRFEHGPRAYDNFVPLLKKFEIPFIDGHRLALQAKASAPAPLFPKGGTHWGQYTASLATNALISELKAQGKSVAPLDYRPVRITSGPGKGEEADLLKLMNLVWPWYYPVAKVRIRPNPPDPINRPNIVFVGGSFMWRVNQQLVASGQFSEIDSFYYYKLYKACNPNIDSGIQIVRNPTGNVDFAGEIFGADCLVLEVNEAAIPSANHLQAFLSDALSHVSTTEDKKPFVYESYQPYQWGEILSFRTGDSLKCKDAALAGFGTSEPGGTWTDGSRSTIRLSLQNAPSDLSLTVQLAAFLLPERLPTQSVKMFINGNLAADWQFTDSDDTIRETTIRKEWLAKSGQAELAFEIKNPTSPKKLGISFDSRSLGLMFKTLTIDHIKQD